MTYHLDSRQDLALRALLSHEGGGAACALCEGPPGCGKTAFGEELARRLDVPLVYALLHAWTDSDELFVGVDVAAAVAGDAASVRQPGVLARAAQLSLEQQVVLVLDEVDKTSERCEALLLDFLQSGRVPTRPGEHVQANLGRIMVIITSNGERELSQALLRRCRRVRFEPLPTAIVREIVRERTNAPAGVVTTTIKACRTLSEKESVDLSPQEVAHATREIWTLAQSRDDVVEILLGWAVRCTPPSPDILKSVADPVWGEVMIARRNVPAHAGVNRN